eukprot:1504088-Prorocentrum_lima.AAC.1
MPAPQPLLPGTGNVALEECAYFARNARGPRREELVDQQKRWIPLGMICERGRRAVLLVPSTALPP